MLDTTVRVATCARFRGAEVSEPAEATKVALRTLARRHLELSAEIDVLDGQIAHLCAAVNPALLAAHGVGPEVAATLLVSAGDNPHRMGSEAAFAALCGASPVEASSGKVTRHRLTAAATARRTTPCGGSCSCACPPTRAPRPTSLDAPSRGKSKKEIVRCLKRHVAREIFRLLTNPPAVPLGAELRSARVDAGITLATTAQALGTWPIRICELRTRPDHDAELAVATTCGSVTN